MIKDNRRDGQGGYAKIMRGGLNQNLVEIRFRSQSGGDVNFFVTVYAQRQPIPIQPPIWYGPPAPGWVPGQYQIPGR